jgi:hypothetical protein
MLTGSLDRSALYGVLADFGALDLDLVEISQLTHNPPHQSQVTAAHADGH